MISPVMILVGVLLCAEPVKIAVSSQNESLVGTVVSTNPQGVHLLLEDQSPRVVPWYEFRAGLLPAEVGSEWEAVAAQAWRAYERLARGDASGALPIYQSLSRTYLWEQGPQSMDVCDGLVRCLIAANRRKQAVEPMLASFAAEGLPGAESVPRSSLLDPDLNLRKDLPPVFARTDAGRLVESIEAPVRVRLMHAYFALVDSADANRHDLIARINELKRVKGSRDAGLVLVEQVSFAQAHPDKAVRVSAREALVRRTQTQRGEWIEVWARLGIGVSLIRSDTIEVRDRGLIELIHIIVRLGDVEPELTLFAAQIAHDYLSQTDRPAWGSTLLQEAQRNIQRGHAHSADRGEQEQ